MTPPATPGRFLSVREATPVHPAVALVAVIAVLSAFAPRPCAAIGDVVVGPFAGSILLDQNLRDFQWDTNRHAIWGGLARVSVGRFGVGARVWRASTAQSLNVPGESLTPDIRMTGTELTAETGLAGMAGVRVLALGSAGVLHLGYSPGEATVSDGFGGTVQVNFDPITERSLGLGLAVRRAVGPGLDASLSVERSWFGLDTTHRAGATIVTERRSFGHWTAYLTLTRRLVRTQGAHR